MGFKKKEFTAYAIHSVPLPEDFPENYPLINGSGTTFKQKLAEAKTAWAKLQGKDEGFVMHAKSKLQKRLKAIQGNMKHLKNTKRKEWGVKVFKRFERVEVMEVERDYSEEYVQWVQKVVTRNWTGFPTMDFFRNFAVAPIQSRKDYDHWRQILEEGTGTNYPIIRTLDDRYFCIRVVGSTTVALPFVIREKVEKIRISNLEGVFLQETMTRNEAVEYMVKKSNENEYDAEKLKKKLKTKIQQSRRKDLSKRTTNFGEPFPFVKKADREGKTQFILELVD